MSSNTSSMAQHNKNYIQNNAVRTTNQIVKKNELTYPAAHKQRNGILSLKGKSLHWQSGIDDLKVNITLERMIEKQTAFNNKKDTALLLIITYDCPDGYIFSFSGRKFLL
jgi:hypothetical protein